MHRVHHEVQCVQQEKLATVTKEGEKLENYDDWGFKFPIIYIKYVLTFSHTA
jgi:hypothetical protein